MWTQVIVISALVTQIGTVFISLRYVAFPKPRQRGLILIAALVLVGRSAIMLRLLTNDSIDTNSTEIYLSELAVLVTSVAVFVTVLILPTQFKVHQDTRADLEQRMEQQSAALQTATSRLDSEVAQREAAAAALRTAETVYVRALDAQPDRICRYRIDGTLTYANRRYCEVLGYTRDNVVGHSVFEVVPAEFHAAIHDAIQRLSQATPVISTEQYVMHPDSEQWEQWTRHAIYDANGNLIEIQAVGRDITQQRQTERALRESEQRLRQIVEQMPVLIIAMDDAGIIISWSRECERLTGFSAEEIIGNPDGFALLYPDDAYRAQLERRFRELDSDFRAVETTITCKDGSTRTVSWSNISSQQPVPGWNRWAVGIDVTAREQAQAELQHAHASLETQVTERTAELRATQTDLEHENTNRRRAEIALRQSETQLRTTLDAIDDMVYVIDTELRITLCNTALLKFARESGLVPNPIGRTPFEVFPFLPDRLRGEYFRVFETGEILGGEDAFELGPIQWVNETLKTPIRDAEGHVTHVLTVMRDITERTHTAAQIAASEDVTRCLIEQSPYGISMVNTEGIVVEWNTAVAQITGIPREDAMGKYLWDVTQRVMPPEAPREELLTRQKQQMLDFLQGKSTFSHNTKVNIQHEDGSRHTLRFSFVLLQTAQGPMAATFIEDITAD